MDYKIRTISEEEESLLQDFLYQAVFVPEGVPAPPKSIISQPEVQCHNGAQVSRQNMDSSVKQ